MNKLENSGLTTNYNFVDIAFNLGNEHDLSEEQVKILIKILFLVNCEEMEEISCLSKEKLINKIEESVFWKERFISHSKICKEICNKYELLSRSHFKALENIFSKLEEGDVKKIYEGFNGKDELLNYIVNSDYWKTKYSFYLEEENKKRFSKLYENDVNHYLNITIGELNLLKQIFISGNITDDTVSFITTKFITIPDITQFIDRVVQSIERKVNQQVIN